MIRKIDHLVITVKDISATMQFYQCLGFTVRDNGNRYEFNAGDFKINAHILGKELSPHAEHIRTGSNDFCFEIDGSIEEFANMLKEHNIAIELGIVERYGVRGRMESIYLRDPDGNLIEISSYAR